MCSAQILIDYFSTIVINAAVVREKTYEVRRLVTVTEGVLPEAMEVS